MTDDALADRWSSWPPARRSSFQDYFVRLRHDVAGRGRSASPATARPDAPRRSAALDDGRRRRDRPVEPARVDRADPRRCPGVDELLAAPARPVVAVSPIVGGAALKGPADRMLAELGHEPSVVGVARLYAPIAAALVIDPVDAELAPRGRGGRDALPSSRRR